MNIVRLLIVAALLLPLTACKTTEKTIVWPDGSTTTEQVRQFDPDRTAQAVRAIVPSAVKLAIAKEPKARGYIEKAQLAVCSIVAAQKDLSPESLRLAVKATGLNDLETPEVQAAVATVYGIYQAYFSDVLQQQFSDNETMQNLSVVLLAVCDALSEGLAEPTVVAND
jgi:hypothetical protein